MNNRTREHPHTSQNAPFQLRLNNLAWPIKCYWAKYFPIRIVTSTEVEFAATNFEQVYIHGTLVQFNDDVLFCVLAHEWAHRMVSPKSIDVSHRITEAVAAALHIDFELAQLVSDPAIELIVDRSNCEIKLWKHRYKAGFSEVFACFVDELKEKTVSSVNIDSDALQLQQMMLALRMLNASPTRLPAFICHLEGDARLLINLLFEDWYGHTTPDARDHVEKIIRFSKAFYEMLPCELLKQRNALRQLLSQLSDLMVDLAAFLDRGHHEKNNTNISISNSGRNHAEEHQHELFDIRLTRQVTDHLLRQARKPRQTTGLWQPGHSFARLDLKRSFRGSPTLIPGMTTRRKIDSTHMLHREKGKLLRFCLLVDDSYSMSGDEARFSRSICEGINRFAARHDLHIGLITFGQEIDVSLAPERRYQQLTTALSALDGNLGGTNLLPALQRLAQYLESDRDITHAMLITDASFSDWDDCQQQLNNILDQIKMTILLINTDTPDCVLSAFKKHQHAIRFFSINPSEQLNAAMLEEMIQ